MLHSYHAFLIGRAGDSVPGARLNSWLGAGLTAACLAMLGPACGGGGGTQEPGICGDAVSLTEAPPEVSGASAAAARLGDGNTLYVAGIGLADGFLHARSDDEVLWTLEGSAWGTDLVLEGESLYVAGAFSETVALGATELVSLGQRDAYVARVDTAGTIDWAAALGEASDDFALSVDLCVDGTLAVATRTVSAVSIRGLSSDTGVEQWSYDIETGSSVRNAHVACLPDGDVAFATEYGGELSLGGETHPGHGMSDLIVGRLSSGELVWSRSDGSPSTDLVTGLAASSSGRIALAGQAGEGGELLASADSGSAFVAALEADGATAWTRRYPGTGASGVTAADGGWWVLMRGLATALAPATGCEEPNPERMDWAAAFRLLENGDVGGSHAIRGTDVIARSIHGAPSGHAVVAGSYRTAVAVGAVSLERTGDPAGYVAVLAP